MIAYLFFEQCGNVGRQQFLLFFEQCGTLPLVLPRKWPFIVCFWGLSSIITGKK
jgi:hypothetical protein